MSKDSSSNQRPPRSAKLRRRLGVGGLSLVATTGLLGTYIGYPGLRRAYAAVNCGSIYDEASLVSEINRMEAGSCDTLNIPAMTINLSSDLPQVTQAGDFTINGSGQGSTIIDGRGSHSAFSFTSASTVTISGLTIQRAEVAGRGSAVFADNSAVYLDQVTFSGNQNTGGTGGAVYANSLTVRDSIFSYNQASSNGGAIFSAGNTSLANTSFDNNTSGGFGGAIYSTGSASISDSTFDTNTAVGNGGAIYSIGSASISDSTFDTNTADNGGAVYTYASASIARSTFTGNIATQYGGAIGVSGDADAASTLTVTNSTFTDNSALACAAINWYFDANLNFVTIVENNNTNTALLTPGTYVQGDLTLTNSIVYRNANAHPSVTDIDVRGTFTASYSLLTSATSFYAAGSRSLTSLIYGDPLLGDLTNNGGPTLTMMPAANSPVIGMADPTGAPAFDQRGEGYSRTTNGLADMGSVERASRSPAPDLSQMPPAWFQATTRNEQTDQCPTNMHPSWAEWPNDHTGGWTCEWSTWWDVNKGGQGGWVTTPGFNPGRPVSE